MKHEVLPCAPDRLVSYIRNRNGEVVGYAFAELLPGVRNTKLSGRDKMSAPSRRRYTPGIKVALSESIGFILPIKQEVCAEECQRSEYC